MNRYYPMADFKCGNEVCRITTPDYFLTEQECLDIIYGWISSGIKVRRCWIRAFLDCLGEDDDIGIEIDLRLSVTGKPYVVLGQFLMSQKMMK